jgi:hypothetical protein
MMENFSGCRVLAYCVMCNHFHILLEVPPKPKVALTDEQLLKRLGAVYSKAFVATVAKELAGAREVVAQGMAVDPAEYRWSSYGEAMGATGKGWAKAKAGLVRAIMADKGREADALLLSFSESPASPVRPTMTRPPMIPRRIPGK